MPRRPSPRRAPKVNKSPLSPKKRTTRSSFWGKRGRLPLNAHGLGRGHTTSSGSCASRTIAGPLLTRVGPGGAKPNHGVVVMLGDKFLLCPDGATTGTGCTTWIGGWRINNRLLHRRRKGEAGGKEKTPFLGVQKVGNKRRKTTGSVF